MLRERIIGGLLLFIPVVASVVAGGIWFTMAAFVLLTLGLLEFSALAARGGHRVFGGLLLLWLILFLTDRLLPAEILGPGVAALLLLGAAWSLVRYRQGTVNAITGFAMTVLGAFYIGWSGAHFVGIRQLEDGLFWTLAVFMAVGFADTFAYFGGRAFGRNRLMPDVSPKKTWEGYISGIVVGGPASAALTLLWQALGASSAVSPLRGLILGLLIAAIVPVGDLTMSMIKRYTQTKDSSTLIPGHGGILDRADTVIIAGLLAYYYLTFFVV